MIEKSQHEYPKHLFIVEYRFQGDFMQEESFSETVVEAKNEVEARSIVEFEKRFIRAGVLKITRCEDDETDYVVDLCDGVETLHTFTVKERFPLHDRAKSKAFDIIHREFPDFSQKLRENGILQQDNMVIVRPARWIKNGKKAYEVTVAYRWNDPAREDKVCDNYFIHTISATNAEEAVRIGKEKTEVMFSATVLSASVVRVAEFGR